jgi:hypothetical protein
MYPATRSFIAPWYSGAELFVDTTDIWVLDEGGVAGFYSARFGRKSNIVALEYIAVAVPGQGMGVDLLEHLKTRVRLSGTHQVIRAKTSDRSFHFWIRQKFSVGEDGRAEWST